MIESKGWVTSTKNLIKFRVVPENSIKTAFFLEVKPRDSFVHHTVVY